ncbi:extracellular solute-binding protein [Haloprofundus salilacus]|uniref:extracellular solute-binding protein n=1 Tax=Haloprofundus salilacus TaxID=2876190 RepID=UPI001CCBB0D5|nr:extracellular solute-binding protein [Haloprofundus salilacus]
MNKQRKISRRTYLKASGSLTAVGLTGLAGCTSGGDGENSGGNGSGDGGGNGSGGGGGSADGGDASLREEYGLQELDYELEDRLNIFQWGDYWPDETVSEFEQAYGVEVNVSNYASNEEMFNKLNAGGTGQYDLIFPSDYMISVLADQEMIRQVERSKVPNLENITERFTDAPYDPGDALHSVPYQWGTSGIGFNREMLGEDVSIDSWDAMWNEEWSGQITMLDDMRETIGAALKQLGYSLNTKNESEVQEAKELLIQQKDLLKTYDSSNFKTNLINKQASPVHGWSGDVFAAYWETYEDGSSPIDYVVPKEGGVVWVDNGAITSEAKHPNAAHAFMNYYLNPQIGAKITNWTYYASPNEAAKEHIDSEILENESIYPSDQTMENLEFIQNIGQATTMYDEAWTEIQNA